MNYFFHDGAGLIHLLSSILAMIFGLAVLVMKKGTRQHVRMGYLYFASMVMLLASSFLIQRLFGGFGLFHWMAIASIIILFIGMVPIWFRRPRDGWKVLHYNFMYWSVVALYEAFMAEILTRIPGTSFMLMVAVGVGVILCVGFILFFKNKKKWEAEIGV